MFQKFLQYLGIALIILVVAIILACSAFFLSFLIVKLAGISFLFFLLSPFVLIIAAAFFYRVIQGIIRAICEKIYNISLPNYFLREDSFSQNLNAFKEIAKALKKEYQCNPIFAVEEKAMTYEEKLEAWERGFKNKLYTAYRKKELWFMAYLENPSIILEKIIKEFKEAYQMLEDDLLGFRENNSILILYQEKCNRKIILRAPFTEEGGEGIYVRNRFFKNPIHRAAMDIKGFLTGQEVFETINLTAIIINPLRILGDQKCCILLKDAFKNKNLILSEQLGSIQKAYENIFEIVFKFAENIKNMNSNTENFISLKK